MPSSGVLRRVALVTTTDVLLLLVTANIPSSPTPVTLMEAIRSSETSVLTRDT
jgi:hypothetical protein